MYEFGLRDEVKIKGYIGTYIVIEIIESKHISLNEVKFERTYLLQNKVKSFRKKEIIGYPEDMILVKSYADNILDQYNNLVKTYESYIFLYEKTKDFKYLEAAEIIQNEVEKYKNEFKDKL